MKTTSPVFFAASGAHMCEELVSSCGSAANPYRRSMMRLLEYVGLQHYGTPQATVPPRTTAEDDAIAQHLEAVKEATARHEASVRQRNIRINKRKPTSALVDILASAATATATTTGQGASERSASGMNASTSSRQPPTIYLSFEDSAEWKAFLASITPEDRLAVTVRRRLTVELWRAHRRDICLWCWFPRNMCVCAQLDAYRAAMPAHVLDAHVEVTMLLHSEEVMRSTNSGHIAAYLLGAPIRVWGMDADDFYLRALEPCCVRRSSEGGDEEAANSVALSPLAQPLSRSAEGVGSPVVVYNVSLYPSAESTRMDEFIRRKQLGLTPSEVHDDIEENKMVERSGDVDEAEPLKFEEDSGCVAPSYAANSETAYDDGHGDATVQRAAHKKMHLILLDSTWGQALSLNRKLSKFIPRVRLEIPDSYESLFQALRKRTRESGVSTLEATSMAVEQCIRVMGYTDEAAQTSSTLTAAMKNFVDARCLLKYAEAQFTTDGAVLDAFRDKRDDARRDDAARRQVVLSDKMQHDAEARRLRLPPVLNYCYCCDCVIGWHRMPEHVIGRNHRTALQLNPTCAPSPASRVVAVPDFARPTRAERAAEWRSRTSDEAPTVAPLKLRK
ncbi:hypothetical protein ABB37_04808 [Leptomonas pyrrhocoris]|uniref:tRNA-uridine aminocarboxypropyltransferase n=1 Tax=Leptomonas pyrrhocoris TaxID=157538 RepID=A0A0N0DVM9_LEPPY|nr:hypothetical protein ABB37_04808 [Leptomonas pyrrhocoris]KPA80612.1 hypothetical protein ABB37_04808 [Leptomonas pyrrhocoris]|eukprot:XP_015659051.1 hypothetical protein ABB37_04808 [Leptomonas pyrrhocoris]